MCFPGDWKQYRLYLCVLFGSHSKQHNRLVFVAEMCFL
jgi:hypothetical protein